MGEYFSIVGEFYNVCTRRKLGVNDGKSKMMFFVKRKVQVVDFNTPLG